MWLLRNAMQANKGTASRKADLNLEPRKYSVIILALFTGVFLMLALTNKADGEGNHEPPDIRGIYKIGSEDLGRFRAELPDSGSAYLAGKAAQKLADQAAEAEKLRAEAQRLQELLDAENARTPQLVSDFTNASEAPRAPSPVSSNAAKAFIYDHESDNEPCKINGGAIDCNYQGEKACGLGQAYPCSKLRAACALSDYACQDAFFDSYAIGRYGSWEGAYDFWLSNSWW